MPATNNHMNPKPEQIKEARTNAGLTMMKLADIMDCSRMTVHNWETGTHPMKSRDWEYMNIKLDDFNGV